MRDRNGVEIKEGDRLHHPMDRAPYYIVLKGDDGKLYLGDFASPLERYAPERWWEVLDNVQSKWRAACGTSKRLQGAV